MTKINSTTGPQNICDTDLDQVDGGMFFLPDPNQMHDLLEPTPTLEDYGRDVLHGGLGEDRIKYAT